MTVARAALIALVAASSSAHADLLSRQPDWVQSSSISVGPRWIFRTTPNGHLGVGRGDAGTFVVGRDRFLPGARTALMLEAQLGSVLGGRGRTEHAGGAFGLKLRTAHRVELGAAIAVFYHFDPMHLREGNLGPAAVAQLSFDLDGEKPFTTRILFRAQLQHPTPSTTTLETFIGVGTRWP